uniref:RNA-directed RNA polymerase n=1 Tax=Nasutitermes takasagoensis chuvirus 1 TaxID=3133479 RepID=A0AAT9JN67_9VIRU
MYYKLKKQHKMNVSQRQHIFSTPTSLVFSRKFDVALRSSYAVNFLQRVRDGSLTHDDQLLTQSCYSPDFEQCRTSGELYSKVLRTVVTCSIQGKTFGTKPPPYISDLQQELKRTLSIQWEYMHSNNFLPNRTEQMNKVIHKLESLSLDLVDINLIGLCTELGQLVDKLHRIHATDLDRYPSREKLSKQLTLNHHVITDFDLSFLWSSRLVVITYNDEVFLLPKEYVLLMHNKCCDLISVLILLKGQEDVCYEEDAREKLISFLLEMTKLYIKHKEDFFHIAKTLESLCIAETLLVCDDWTNDEFLIVLTESLEELMGFKYEGSKIREILVSCSIPFRHELACLSKVFGHPLMNIEHGVKELHDKTTKTLEINARLINESVLMAKQNYIRNYILRNGTWPPCEILNPFANKGMVWARLHNKDPHSAFISRKFGVITHLDYKDVEILKNMDFDPLENYIPYLKDKTITVLKDRLFGTLLAPLFDPTATATRPKWAETRLLLAFLLAPDIMTAHLKYIARYDICDDLSFLADYLVIRVVPKEKELKTIFRGFGCKTYEDRGRSLAQERNSMRFLDLFSDEQAMTLSELELVKKLYAFRTLQKAYPGYTKINLLIDSKSWNNMQRDEAIKPIGEGLLDPLFGTTIFSKTHEAYHKTLFYVEDESVTYVWEGQAGGIEGLNQDTWVIAYINQIKVAMLEFEYPYHIFCKGDDLRVVVLIPPTVLLHQKLSDIKNNIVEHIAKVMTGFGHTIKVEDSYGSATYFAFSKEASIGTIQLPQTFRKIQKAHGANNAFLPTLDEYVAATYSNAHSACRVGTQVIAPYLVAIFWTLYYLHNTEEFAEVGINAMCALLLTPSVVGGFPIIYLHNMYVRAESDLLSPFLGLSLFALQNYPEIGKFMMNFWKTETTKTPNLKQLWCDPYSVRVGKPPLPMGKLRQILTTQITNVAKNREVLKLIKLAKSKENAEILSWLETAVPCQVKVLANLYACTPEGILQELTRKFETGRSILELLFLRLGRRRSGQQLRSILRAEIVLQRWRRDRLVGKRQKGVEEFHSSTETCPSRIADQYRAESWGREIHGVTMPPLQHQLSYITEYQALFDPWAQHNHFLYHVFPPTQKVEETSTQHWATSDKKPFLGFTTRTGMTSPTVNMIKHDPILNKLKILLDLLSWTDRRKILPTGEIVVSNVDKVIEVLISMFTDTPMSQLAPFAGQVKSGTIKHHMRSASFRESIVPNILSNVYQQIVGETNTHRSLRKKGSHYSVNFLHVFCYSTTILFSELEASGCTTTPQDVWCVTSPCSCTTELIEEEPIRMELPSDLTMQVPHLKAVSVTKAAEAILSESIQHFQYTDINIRHEGIDLDQEAVCTAILQETLDYTEAKTVLIRDRYQHHVLSDEGSHIMSALTPMTKTRDIGLTELKRIPIHIIGYFLLTYARWKLDDILLLQGLIPATLMFASIEGRSLPWYGLILQLHRASRLPEVLLWISGISLLPCPMCHTAPSAATHYIGQAALHMDLRDMKVPILVCCSYYQNTDIIRHIRPRVRSLQRQIYIQHFREALNIAQQDKTSDVQVVIRLVAQLVMLTLADPSNDDYMNDMVLKIREQGLTTLPIITFSHVNVAALDMLLDSEDLRPSFLNYLIKRMPRLPWQEANQYLLEHFGQVIQEVITLTKENTCKLVWTNLTYCIEAIRAYEFQVFEEELRPLPSLMTHQDLKLKPVKKNDRLTRLLPVMESGQRIGVIESPSLNFLTSKLIMTSSYYKRPYGAGTTSQNKFIECLALIGLEPPFQNHLHIATLGEGVGGVLELLSSATKGSIFLHNTLPPDETVDTSPWVALGISAENNNAIQSSHLNIGYSDLASQATLMYYETEYGYKYHIVTCDAEVKDPHSTVRTHIVRNVVRFFLRNKTPKGVLILKWNCAESKTVVDAVGDLQGRVSDIILRRCESSHWGGEVFLIAFGSGSRPSPLYEDEMTPASYHAQRLIHRFRENVFTFYQTLAHSKPRTVVLTKNIKLFETLLKWFDYLIPAFINKVNKNCGLTVTWSECLQALKEHTFDKFVQDILTCGAIIGKQQLRELKKPIFQDVRNATWDTNTRTHISVAASRWLCLSAFIHTVTTLWNVGSESVLSESELRKLYVSLIQSLPARLKWHPVNGNQYTKTFVVDGFRSSPYEAFLKGVSIGLSLLSYRNLVTKVRRYNVKRRVVL